jgi:hypothetical protein
LFFIPGRHVSSPLVWQSDAGRAALGAVLEIYAFFAGRSEQLAEGTKRENYYQGHARPEDADGLAHALFMAMPGE